MKYIANQERPATNTLKSMCKNGHASIHPADSRQIERWKIPKKSHIISHIGRFLTDSHHQEHLLSEDPSDHGGSSSTYD